MKTAIKMFPGFGWIETQRTKFGPIFNNKVHQKLQLSKYVNNKSCSHIFQNCAIFDLPTLVESSRIYTGQYTFPVLLLNDDNLLEEHN